MRTVIEIMRCKIKSEEIKLTELSESLNPDDIKSYYMALGAKEAYEKTITSIRRLYRN